MTIMPENKITQSTLNDFLATVKAEPNISDSDILKSFPEFNNDKTKLDAAWAYKNTLDSKKYKSLDEVNTKFPEFFGQSSAPKPVEEKGFFEKAYDNLYEKAQTFGETVFGANSNKKAPEKPIILEDGEDTSAREVFLKNASKQIYGSTPENLPEDPYQQAAFLENVTKLATVQEESYKSVLKSNQPWEEKSKELTKLNENYSKPYLDRKNTLLAEIEKVENQLNKIEQISKSIEGIQKARNDGKDVVVNDYGVRNEDGKLFEQTYVSKQYNLAEAGNEKIALLEKKKLLQEEFSKNEKDNMQLQKVLTSPAYYINPLSKASQENPDEILSLSQEEFGYKLAKTQAEIESMDNEEKKQGRLYPYNTTIEGKEVKDLLNEKVILSNSNLFSWWDRVASYFRDNPGGIETEYLEEKLGSSSGSTVGGIINQIQNDAYNGANTLEANAEANKKAYSKAITDLQNFRKEQLLEAKKNNQTVSPEWENQINAKIAEYSTLLTKQDDLIKKSQSFKNTYLKDFKDFQEYKLNRDNYAKNWNILDDVANPVAINHAIAIASAPQALVKYKDMVLTGVGLMSKEEQTAKELNRYYSNESNPFTYIPEPLKNAHAFHLKEGQSISDVSLDNFNGRAIVRDGINTTIESLLLYQTGVGIGKATGLSNLLNKGGKIGKYFSDKVGIIPASSLLLEGDIQKENVELYLQGVLNSIDEVIGRTEGQKFIEGATEMLWTPEANLLKSVTKEPLQEFALKQLFKKSLGEGLVTPELKYLIQSITKNLVATPLEESFEEVAGNKATDWMNLLSKKNNLRFNPEEQFTLLSNFETAVNTTLGMLPTMLFGLGKNYTDRHKYLSSISYEVGANANELFKYAQDYILNSNEEDLKKVFPNFVSKQQLIQKVLETNNDYRQAYEDASPITSKMLTESDKIEYFNTIYTYNQLVKDPNKSDENLQKLSDLQESMLKVKDGVEKRELEYRNDYKKALSKDLPVLLSSFDYNSVNIPTLQEISKNLENLQNKFLGDASYQKQREDISKLQSKVDSKISNLKQAAVELSKTPEQKAEENNQSGVITLQRPELGSLNIELNVPYHLSSIDSKNEAGNLLKSRPIVTILQDNGDGTVKVAFNNEEVRDVPLEELSKYEFDKEEDVKTLRKERNPKIIAWDNENNVVKYEWDNEAKGVRAKSHTGRLRWNEEKKSVEFVYKNLKGEVVAINVPQKELLKYAKSEKGSKLSFVKSLVQNADQKKEEEKSKESINKSDLTGYDIQRLRRRDLFQEQLEKVLKPLTKIEEKIQKVSKNINELKSLIPTLREAAKLNNSIKGIDAISDLLTKSEKQQLKNKTPYEISKFLLAKAKSIETNTYGNLQELENSYNDLEKQKQDLDSSLQEEIDFINDLIDAEYSPTQSIKEQLKQKRDELKEILDSNSSIINTIKNTIDGLKELLKKVSLVFSQPFSSFFPLLETEQEENENYTPKEINDDIKSLENDLEQKLANNEKLLKDIKRYDKIIKIVSKKEKEFDNQKNDKKKQELLSKIFLTPSGNVVDTEDNEQLTEYDPKVDLLLSGSATTTGGTESNPLPNQSVIDLQEFLNSVGNIRNYRLLAVTKDNAKNFGLESVIYTDETFTNKTDEESDNDIVLVLVLNNNSDTPTFVDKQGNPLESPTKDSVVYTKMRTSSLTFGSKNTKAGEKNYSTTLSEEQEAKIAPKISDLRKTLRQNTINHIKGGNNAYFEIKGISRGHVQDQSDSPKSVVGNLIPSDVDLSVEQVIQIPKQTDAKNAQGDVQFAGDGSIRQFPKGRPVLNFRQYLAFLHTKKFTQKDLTKLLDVFKYLYDNIENKQEVDVILDYLKKTLYFRDPSKISPITDKSQQSAIAKQQIWISRDGNGNNFVHFGNQDFKIPFSFENVDNILALQTFLTQIPGGLYHNVDFQDTKDGNVMMKPFTEISGVDKQGNLVARQWATYQQYLLSDKYPDGQLRPVDEIPLYTKVNPSTPNNPNVAGRYIVFGNEGGNYETALKDIKTQEVKAVIPQVPSVQGDVNLVSKPNIKSFNDIKEPGEYILQSVTDKNVMYSITWDGKKVTVDDVQGVNAKTSEIETALTNAVLGKTKSNTVFITWKNEPKEQPKPNNLPTPEVKSTTPEEKTELANTNQAVPDFPTESLSEDEIFRILTQGTEEAQSTDTEYRKVTRNSQYKLIDIEKSKAWWQERFPQIPFQYVTGFINNKAFGALYKGAVTISRAAEVGTEFHEAFEVYWKHFSTPAQMRRSIREFKNRKGTFVDYETGETIEFSKATYHQIKEQLAEEYREYELSNGKIKWEGEFNKNSLFRRIFNAIHDFFLNTQTTEEVFKAISDGKFKTAKPKNLNLNNLNAENRISQLKKNSVFFNDAMKSITFYLFDSLNKDEKSIVDIFNEVGKVNQNLDKQYDVVKQKLEIFYSANNLPTFLSLTKEQFIKAFSNRAFYDSYTKISPDLKNALNQVVVQQKLTDIEMAEKLYDVFVSANVLLKNWDEAVQLNKNYLSKYGVEFIESEEEINEDDKTSEYTPEITKYNKKQNTNAEIKALIATLTSKYYQKVFTSEFSTNQVTPKVNSILQPELVDFGATFVKLLYKLAPTSTFEEMSEMLIKESKENDPSLINLVNRLQLENKGELSSYVVELRNKFYQAMNSMVVDYDNLMINTNLTGNPINVNDVKHKNKIKFKWVNNLKSSSFVVYGEDGSMQFSSTSFTKPSDLTTAIEFLKEIGFNTTFKKGELSPKEIQVVLANSSKIYEVIKSTQAAQIFWQNAAILNKQIDELADIEQKYSNDYFESQHINIEGEPVSNILLNNFLGYVTKAFNYAPTLDKFYEAVPQLNPKNLNNAFQKNSLILDKNTRFFDENGKEKSKISISILEGVKDRESEKYTHTSEMSESDMFAQEFSYNLDGKYSILTPADSRTPWGWNIGTFVSKEEAKTNKKYLEIFKKYLIAEIETARQENVYSLAELSKKRNKLRFFDGIINIDVNNNISPEQLIKQNEAKIEEEFSKLLEENVKKTIDYLTNNNLIKDFKPESGTFATVVGEKPSRMVVYTSTSNQPTGLSDEQLEDLVRFREINYMINIIEQHKVLWGDPAQWKAATKRIKSYLSGRRLSINNAKYFDDYNNKFSNQRSFVNKDGEIETFQLEPTDKGFHFFSDIIKTQTFQDVLAIPADNILNSIKESLAKLQDSEVDKYEEGVEADAQALIFLPGYREIRKRDTTWSNKEEEVFLWDEANMFQDLLNRSANPIDFYPKGKKGEKLKEAHRQILKKGNPFLSRLRNDEDLPVINVLKPIYSGFKNVDAAIQNIDKMSGAPLTWSLVKGTNLEPFYIAHYVKGTHYVKLESANKIGKRADIEPLYVNGRANTNVKQEELNFKYFGIQVETIAQKETSTLGTQMTKLITSGLMKFGVPIDTKYTRDEWNKLTEQEKENSSKLYRLVKRNHSILSNMKALAKKDLFNKFGISETTIDGKKVYEFKNLLKLNDLIQREFKQRDVAENIKELIKVVVKDGKEKFVAPLDAIIGAEKLEAMFTSIIDKSILRPKMRGGQLPQVSSTLFEKNNRKAVYKKGEKWVNVTNFEILTKEEKDSVRLVSENLKFYEDVDGKRYCEVILPYSFKDMLKEGDILSIDDIPDELKYGVGFRIPTQGHNSIENFKIKGFLPIEYGDAIIVPSEITTKAGSDFDIDKLNIYLYNYVVDKNGIPQKIKFLDGSNSTPEERYREYVKSKTFDILDEIKDEESFNEIKETYFKPIYDKINKVISTQVDKSAQSKATQQAFQDFKQSVDKLKNEKLRRNIISIVSEKEDSIYERQETLDSYLKDNAFKEISSLSKEDKKVVSTLLLQYGEYVSLYNKTKDFRNILKDVIKETKGYEEFKKEFKEAIKNSFADFIITNELGNPSFEEFSKLPIEQQNSKKALENAYLDNTREILQLPEVFSQLVNPNTVKPLEDIAKKVRELNKISDRTTAPLSNYLSSLNNTATRYMFLVGKRGVGIAAKNNTSHAIFMELGIEFNPNDLIQNSDSLRKKGIIFNISMPYNQKNGRIVMSNDTDAEGVYKISDVISMFLNAFVDIANNPFISDVNGNLTTAGIYLTGVRMGIPISYLGRFMSQPIIKDFIRLKQNNKSISTIVSGGTLFPSEMINILQDKYGFQSLINERENNYSLKELEDFITNPDSAEFGQEQGYILGQYLILDALSKDLFIFDQAFPDTTRTVSFESIRIKLFNINKVKETVFKNYLPSLLKNTFLGATIKPKYEILQALRGKNDEESLYVSEKSVVRKYLDPILFDIYSKFISMDEKETLAKDMKRQLISYFIQTIPVSFNNELPQPLTSQIERLLLNPQDRKTIASRLRNVQFALQEGKLDIPNQTFIPNLLSVFPTLSKKLTTTVNLLRKPTDKIDADQLTNDFSTLFDYGQTRAFAEDLVKTALLKSGVTYSPNSFTEVIPSEIFENIITQIEEKINNSAYTEQLLNNFWNSYVQNNYYNEGLAFSTKARNSSDKTRIRSNILSFIDPATKQKRFIPVIQYNVIKNYGENVYFPKDVRSKYLLTTVEQYKIEPQDGFPDGEYFSKKEKEEMKKKGDYSFLKRTLWLRVDALNPNTGKVEPVMGEMYLEQHASNWDYVMYVPIPLMGDRSNLLEHYPTMRGSKVNDFSFQIPKVKNQILSKETIDEYLSKLKTPETFYQYLTTELSSSFKGKFFYEELKRLQGLDTQREKILFDEEFFEDMENVATFTEMVDFEDSQDIIETLIGNTETPTQEVIEQPIKLIKRDGQEYYNTPRIRFFVKIGDELRASLPKVKEGYTRLYRGNRPSDLKSNPSFTNSLEGIALPFLMSYNGQLSYIDIKTEDLFKYLQTGGVAKNSEFIVTPEIAKSATPISNEIVDKYKTKYPDKFISEEEFNIEQPIQNKEGVDFVFKQSPELANEVYEALGFGQESINYYEGNITPEPNTVFVFGSNPEGRHGAGAAKIARDKFGAVYGQGEGLQGNAYALPTKDLRVKENRGFKSISSEQIINNIKKLYETAKQNPNKQFKVAYRNTTDTSLNGYTGLEMIEMFNQAGHIPSNIIFSKEWVDTGKLSTQPQITPEQKQQAQQLYSQYLDSIGVTDIAYHHSEEDISEFTSSSERYFQKELKKKNRYIPKLDDIVFLVKKPLTEEFMSKRKFIGSWGLKTPKTLQFSAGEKIGEGVHPGIDEGVFAGIEGNYDAIDFGRIRDNKTWSEVIAITNPKNAIKLGSKQDIEGFKKFIEQPINKEIKLNEIYNQLRNKTQSENVVIKSWGELKDVTEAITPQGIVSTRIKNSNEHFGNPFSHDPAGKTQGLIKTETIKEAVEKYIDWLITDKYDFDHPLKPMEDKEFNKLYEEIKKMSGSTNKNIQERFALNLLLDLLNRKKWIKTQIQSGELKGKPILYYKELGEPSHATALDYLINKYDWNKNQPTEIKPKIERTIQYEFETSGILKYINKKANDLFLELRDNYKIPFIPKTKEDLRLFRLKQALLLTKDGQTNEYSKIPNLLEFFNNEKSKQLYNQYLNNLDNSKKLFIENFKNDTVFNQEIEFRPGQIKKGYEFIPETKQSLIDQPSILFMELFNKAGLRPGTEAHRQELLKLKKFIDSKTTDLLNEAIINEFKTQEQPIVEETLQLKDGKNYNKSEINTKLLESLGYTPSEIGKILKEIC